MARICAGIDYSSESNMMKLFCTVNLSRSIVKVEQDVCSLFGLTETMIKSLIRIYRRMRIINRLQRNANLIEISSDMEGGTTRTISYLLGYVDRVRQVYFTAFFK
jgi:hypothetical protein